MSTGANTNEIQITATDETPQLAWTVAKPLYQMFTDKADVQLRAYDISLAGRTLALWGQADDDLKALGSLVKTKDAALVKLPNISATAVQLQAAIAELRQKGHDIPAYPEDPQTAEEADIKKRYDSLEGSVVNPVLRQGNSERHPMESVKYRIKKKPHDLGTWSPERRTRVTHMQGHDFLGNEQSQTVGQTTKAKMQFVGEDGEIQKLEIPNGDTPKTSFDVLDKNIVDSSVMERAEVRKFLAESIETAKEEDLVPSFHFKATMMIRSDGVLFGDAVELYFKNVFEKHKDTFEKLNIDPKNGIADLEEKISEAKSLEQEQRDAILQDLQKAMRENGGLPIVNPKENEHNLSRSGSSIIDISMARLAQWGEMAIADNDGKIGYKDSLAIIPDRTYAQIYDSVFNYLKEHGQVDPKTMGSMENLGLMAQKAEEYGSKNTTFEAPGEGKFQLVDDQGNTIAEHAVQKGDIWRVCNTTDASIQNWIELAAERASKYPDKDVVFWLDENRPHDQEMIQKVEAYFDTHDKPANIKIMAPADAATYSLKQMCQHGRDVISVTGNVNRDYLTDLCCTDQRA